MVYFVLLWCCFELLVAGLLDYFMVVCYNSVDMIVVYVIYLPYFFVYLFELLCLWLLTSCFCYFDGILIEGVLFIAYLFEFWLVFGVFWFGVIWLCYLIDGMVVVFTGLWIICLLSCVCLFCCFSIALDYDFGWDGGTFNSVVWGYWIYCCLILFVDLLLLGWFVYYLFCLVDCALFQVFCLVG